MRTANTGNGNNNTDKIQKKYKEEEERLLKARKKREEKEKIAEKQAEKKAEEEKAAERRAERKEHMEKLMEGTYKVSAIGTDMKSVTQNIVEVVSCLNIHITNLSTYVINFNPLTSLSFKAAHAPLR